MNDEMLHRSSLVVRSVDRDQATDEMTFSGVAVPWNDPIRVWDWDGEYTEEIARGAVIDSAEPAKILWQHRTAEPIGKITAAEDTAEGWEITASISNTERGREAYTLLKDGVIDRLSIGFIPITTETKDVDGVISKTRTEIDVKEVSLVTWPAYDGAKIGDVRAASTSPTTTVKEPSPMDTETPEIREELDDMKRSLALFQTALDGTAKPKVSAYRSAGEILKAIVSGDDEARAEYEDTITRAFSGATTEDTALSAAWVGDLTRIVETTGPLGSVFSSGVLPESGMSIEYAQLASNTHAIDEQVNEGDDLSYGEIKIEPATAPVKTFGGYTELTQQLIKRSSVNYLDATLRAMAVSAGRRREAALRANYQAAVAASIAAGNITNGGAMGDIAGIIRTLIGAQEIFQELGLSISALVADKDTFEQLATVTTGGGEPLLSLNGKDHLGNLDLTSLSADLAGFAVVLDTKLEPGESAFVNTAAIRAYNSPIVTLQGENVINLTKQYSVFYQSALADEIPDAIVPLG